MTQVPLPRDAERARPRATRLLPDALVATARRLPEKAAVVHEDEVLTYRELLDRSRRIARLLRDGGVRRGDRVAIYMDSGPWVVACVYGALLADAAFVVVNPQTREEKLRYILQDCAAAALLADGRAARRLPGALQERHELRVLALHHAPEGLGVLLPGAVGLEAALASAEPHEGPNEAIPLDLAALVYTSGSTGDPKGVMLSHQNMTFAQESLAEYLRLQEDDRILNVLPLAFDYGLYQALLAVRVGATLVLESSFAFPARTVARIRQHGVTVLPGVPTIFATLLSMHRREALSLPSVKTITNTGAHLPDAYLAPLLQICPGARIYKMYGLTECKRVCYLEPERLFDKPGSVGKAIPGTEVAVLGADGTRVPPGVAGTLHVRGPHVMMGYWNLPEETARMLVPGPYPGERKLCTHDRFRVDEEGFLYFLGRTDDIIKSGGEKISPAEVEGALSTVPGVRQIAVDGVPDPLLGHAVRVHVVLDADTEMSEAQFRRHCIRRLEGHMVPRDIIFLEHLPETENGKVRKAKLGGRHELK